MAVFVPVSSRGGFATRDFASKVQCYRGGVLSGSRRRARLWLLGVFLGCWIVVVIGRLTNLQILNVETWQSWGVKQHRTEISVASERGPLYDRLGRLLAVSVPAGSVYVRPGQIKDKDKAGRALAALLKIDAKEVLARMNEDKPFVWVKRQIPRAAAQQAGDLNIPGVGFLLESKRYYPYNFAASRLIGKVGVDGEGLSGIERMFERHLHGEQMKTAAIRDALGNLIQNASVEEQFELPRGDSMALTIDAEMQSIMDEELEAGRKSANSKHAMGIMIDADTGEVLAMGQAPLVNFNSDRRISKQDLHNLAVETVFEPGSIMKPMIAAAAIDAKLLSPHDMLNCENGRYPFGRHVIKDVHPQGVISLKDVVVRSSNIGMTKVGLRLGKDRLYQALVNFGFGQRSALHLPGETPGILRSLEGWAPVDVATHSFGQGVAVTPLQMVRAVAAIANGGFLPELSIIKTSRKPQVKRILSEKAAASMREIMYAVVEDEHGTGSKGAIQGVRVGGKTGTAQKARAGGRGYQHGAYAASFEGFVDAKSLGIDRTLALLVIIDEPRANSIYGGTLAAPVFQRIMQRTLHLLSASYELKNKPHFPESLENIERLGNSSGSVACWDKGGRCNAAHYG